jgi:3-methyladenine DNA glycosylase AlkD
VARPEVSDDPQATAAALAATIAALPQRNTPSVRAVRRRFSRALATATPDYMLTLAQLLLNEHGLRWVTYELLRAHPAAFARLGAAELEVLGQGIDSWSSVDAFARILSGPAWLAGQVGDDDIFRWAQADDLWWRRAALVSTVALNVRSQGGMGDAPRTLAVCALLVSDQEDMVVKAMSWALRALVVHDPDAVRAFLEVHDAALAARVKREVRNKLATGLKNPKRADQDVV